MLKSYLALTFFFAAPSIGWSSEACVVADPTGTPLNIRSIPGGIITSSVSNGNIVHLASRVVVANEKIWAEIESPQHGYVLKSYLKCSDTRSNKRNSSDYSDKTIIQAKPGESDFKLVCKGSLFLSLGGKVLADHRPENFVVNIKPRLREASVKRPGQESQTVSIQSLSKSKVSFSYENSEHEGADFKIDLIDGNYKSRFIGTSPDIVVLSDGTCKNIN